MVDITSQNYVRKISDMTFVSTEENENSIRHTLA